MIYFISKNYEIKLKFNIIVNISILLDMIPYSQLFK